MNVNHDFQPELNQGPADLQSTALTTEPYNRVQSNQHRSAQQEINHQVNLHKQPEIMTKREIGKNTQNHKTLVTMGRADMQMTLETLFLEPEDTSIMTECAVNYT